MINNESMKAINCAQYGSSDVLKMIEAEQPKPKENEVLVRIHASSINSYDWHIMRGSPVLVRLREGLFKPKKNKILGTDIAGIVEAVGKRATNFAAGDRVYGCMADSSGDGGYAEYKCVKESVLALVPSGITLEQAASVPMAAVTALQGLRDVGKIQKGQKILINGASGGVGTFAVQLAKFFGAEVTGVCSTRNAEMVRSIGADHVIDYTKEDYTQSGQQYDLILDVVANHTLEECRRALKANGTCAVVGFSSIGFVLKIGLYGKKTTKKDGRKIMMVMADNTKSRDLIFLNHLLESKKVVPVIDGCYQLDDIQKAFDYFEKEHPKGKVIIKVD